MRTVAAGGLRDGKSWSAQRFSLIQGEMLFTYTQVNVAGSSGSILAIGVDVSHDIVLCW